MSMLLRSLSFLAAVAVSRGGEGNIINYSPEVQAENVLRVSRFTCDECTTLEDFQKFNKWAFLLFYDRPLTSTHKYKDSIIQGFHKTCAQLRYSRVVCGKVDMIEDREYAERYIDPKTAPAHIIVKDGQPVAMEKRHLKKLMAKPGDLDTMMWHLQDLLSPMDEGGLQISSLVGKPKALTELANSHTVVVVLTANKKEREIREAVRLAARTIVLRGDVPPDIIPKKRLVDPFIGVEGTPTKEQKRLRKQWGKDKAKLRVHFAVVTGADTLKHHGLDNWEIAMFFNGVLAEESRKPLPKATSAEQVQSELYQRDIAVQMQYCAAMYSTLSERYPSGVLPSREEQKAQIEAEKKKTQAAKDEKKKETKKKKTESPKKADKPKKKKKKEREEPWFLQEDNEEL